jgi:hypothetical protein
MVVTKKPVYAKRRTTDLDIRHKLVSVGRISVNKNEDRKHDKLKIT